MDMERNLSYLKSEHTNYLKYKQSIQKENLNLIQKSKLKEERLRIQMERSLSSRGS